MSTRNDQFISDLTLISQNAMIYNAAETVYYLAAAELRDQMAPLLEQARQKLAELGVQRIGDISLRLLELLKPEEPIDPNTRYFLVVRPVWAPAQ